MSMMFATADSTLRDAGVRKPGFFALLGAAFRVAAAIDSNQPADARDIALLGLPEDLNQRLGGRAVVRG